MRYAPVGRYAPAIVRVLRRTELVDRGYATPCRIFGGQINNKGYGVVRIGSLSDRTRRMKYTHVLVYEHHYGPVPEGLEVSHLCDQTDCCESTHLIAETHAENMRRGVHASKTHCPQNHPYDAANTYVDSTGSRHCRTCRRETERRRYHERKRAAA